MYPKQLFTFVKPVFFKLVCFMLVCFNLGPFTSFINANEPERFEFMQIRMGVPIKISVYVVDEALANKATSAAFARVKELDRLLSDYDPDSELNQLCHGKPHNEEHKVSEDLFQVLKVSQMISAESNGAFDVTVGPIIKLWRKARRRKKLPDFDELRNRLSSVGSQHLNLSEKTSGTTLKRPNMQLDLGGIAKGYAADEALAVLGQHQITRVLIDFGGDIVVGDPPPNRDYWKIAVAPLKEESGEEVFQYVYLKNASIATSGDAYQFIEIDGRRYSHLVNPKTGLGLTTSSSVTVIAPNGTLADAYASTVSVLGPVKGIDFINKREKMAAFVITEEAEVASANWKEYLEAPKRPQKQNHPKSH